MPLNLGATRARASVWHERTTVGPARPGWVPAVPAHAQLVLLGGFELHRGVEPIPVPLGGQRLLALLALHDRPLVRTQVAGTLWPDTSDGRAAASLRSTLWRVQLLDDALLRATSTGLALGERIWVDVRDCQARFRRLLGRPRPPDLTDLETPWPTGELLPGWYDEWVVIERERFRQITFHVLEARCAHLAALGRFAEAVEAGLAAVAAEPLRESAHRALIQAFLAEGNRGEALRQYELYRRLLDQELHLPPSATMRALVAPLQVVERLDLQRNAHRRRGQRHRAARPSAEPAAQRAVD